MISHQSIFCPLAGYRLRRGGSNRTGRRFAELAFVLR